jgi:hypothetical protein
MTASATLPPTLRLVLSERAKAPATVPRTVPNEDLAAWEIVFEAFDKALERKVSATSRRTLLRCRGLAASRAHRSPLRMGGDD